MLVTLRCRACQHGWQLRDDPLALAHLGCPACGQAAHRRASEDLASALEDALCQLWHVGQAVDIEVALGSAALPPAFAGAPEPP